MTSDWQDTATDAAQVGDMADLVHQALELKNVKSPARVTLWHGSCTVAIYDLLCFGATPRSAGLMLNSSVVLWEAKSLLSSSI